MENSTQHTAIRLPTTIHTCVVTQASYTNTELLYTKWQYPALLSVELVTTSAPLKTSRSRTFRARLPKTGAATAWLPIESW